MAELVLVQTCTMREFISSMDNDASLMISPQHTEAQNLRERTSLSQPFQT